MVQVLDAPPPVGQLCLLFIYLSQFKSKTEFERTQTDKPLLWYLTGKWWKITLKWKPIEHSLKVGL